ncbi:hypothetical protein [Parvibaculum sp.]|uniref:hypothetical protein n=1 Tax=Parvibaculum sp. TaxID=2024848 RepID=UPI002C704DC6|nr:hypothetical protein [Parvibaculum sp.]HUD51689.1 hypothetical protein [Parvibaculum sp.]
MAEKNATTAEIAELQAEVERLTKALEEARTAIAEDTGAEVHGAREAAEEIGERFQEGLSDLQKQIGENPVPSALIAFGIGFLLGRVFTR